MGEDGARQELVGELTKLREQLAQLIARQGIGHRRWIQDWKANWLVEQVASLAATLKFTVDESPLEHEDLARFLDLLSDDNSQDAETMRQWVDIISQIMNMQGEENGLELAED